MKKILLSLGLLAGLSAAAQAQGAKFGIRGGISANTLSGDDDKFGNVIDNYSYGLGGLGGVTAQFAFSDLISLQPELLYNLKGTQIADGKDRLDLHYVDLPILLKVNADGPYFEAGPQVGYLISAKLGGETKTRIETKDLQGLSLGYVAGVGYQLTSGLSLGVRFNGGISSVGKDDDRYDQQRNQSFNFVVGYEFGGK
ncbi:porin family protein [Hymenobacter sp.]|uniref:porin family protein n=1 Tax=Hymenobacter sp. TaxID=1898978 RepID=UPI00286CDC49|nr:porin family protein [Hymenobacter sp.]